jgi:ABC-2 type transport system permease protein
MTSVQDPPVVSPAPAADASHLVHVRVVEGGRRQDLRGVKVVWQRELIRFSQDRIRIVTSLVQPVLYLFVLGTGLSNLTKGSIPGVSYRTVIFPGVLAMSTMFTAMFSSISIVWDREFGFLREMLVAPVRRGALVLGKALGGATTATLQGLIILAVAGAVGVPYSPQLILLLVGEMLLLSFTLTALGMVFAVRIKQMQAVMGLMQMVTMPLLFLSGALFPLGGLPTWLRVVTRINPLTYVVNPMRHAVFDHVTLTAATRAKITPALTWWGWRVPIGVQVLMVGVMGVILLLIATVEFNRAE